MTQMVKSLAILSDTMFMGKLEDHVWTEMRGYVETQVDQTYIFLI
jgi:hypothetical protein